MIRYLHQFQRAVIALLILMLTVVILLSVVELGWVLFRDISQPPVFIIDIQSLLELFGLFLLVLIGVELLETMKKYYTQGHVDLDIIIAVSLIALGRKVITMDPKSYDPLTLIGVAALMLALFAGYWVIKKLAPEVK